MRHRDTDPASAVPAGSLALDFDPRAIGLMARGEGGWEKIGEAILGADDFAARMDELRVEALVRAPAKRPATLLLPPEQVVLRELYLQRRGAACQAEARAHLAAALGYAEADLLTAVGPGQAGATRIVLAALRQTVEEAQTYARRWGFTPGPVSTSVAAAAFAPAQPVFRGPEPVARRVTRTGLRALGAAAGATALAAIVYAGTQLAPMLRGAPAPEAFEQRLPTLASARLDTGLTDGPPSALGVVRLTPPQRLGHQRARIVDNPTADMGHLSTYGAAPSGPPPDRAPPPAASAAFAVGAAPAPVTAERPARLGPPTADHPAPEVTAVLAALALIRDDAAAPTEAEADAPAPVGSAEQHLALAPTSVPEPPERPRAETTPPTAPADQPAVARADGGPDAMPRGISVYAVLSAPQPPARPTPPAQPTQPATVATTTPPSSLAQRRTAPRGPASVRDAAQQRGLTLDEAALIGVIQASSGRQALVRLPDGAFRRVIRGDVLDGWRVSAISRDAVRLTRRGQNRTLLLVSR